MKSIFDSYFDSYFKEVNDVTEKGFVKAAKFYQAFYKSYLPENKNAKILDVACGPGHFLYFLENQGYKNYFGIDLSPQQIRVCHEKTTKKAEVADAFKFLSKKKNEFDLLVTNDFLEHIDKPKLLGFLELVYNSLKKNGRFFIKVPNMSNPFSLMDRYSDFTHEIGFTEFSLKQVLQVAGFKTIAVKGSAYPLISVKNILGKVFEVPFYLFLKAMFRIQGHSAPKILDKDLVVIAEKK